jgi:hypothetical protein
MRDVNMSYTQVVPGQMDEFLDQPKEEEMLNRPYVYVDPFAALSIQSQSTPGVMDPFGAIIDPQNVPSGSDLLPETEGDVVPDPVLAEEPEVM